MRTWLTVREALATTWAAKVPSALVAFLVAAMCTGTLATVGRTVAAEEQLLERMDSAGARLLSVSDTRNDALISQTIVDQTAGLSAAERAIGTLPTIDVINGDVGPGGTLVPAWGVHGDLSGVARLTGGRWPGPGEAIVSEEAMSRLGLDAPVGWLAPASTTTVDDWAVVGRFEAREPFTNYESGVLYVAPQGRSLTTLHVVLTSAEAAQQAQTQVLGLIDPPTIDSVGIISPVSLAQLQEEVSGDLANFGRALLLGVLGGGALLVAIVTLADVLVRRKDLGRRRALGATRGTIVTLVVLRTLVPTVIGAGLGTAAGLYVTSRLGAGALPPWQFTLGTAILALLATSVAAVAPAVYAATRDPVRVLRTP